MSKHVDTSSLSRESLIKRYAKARGIETAAAAGIFANVSREELRRIVEGVEAETRGNRVGNRSRFTSMTTTVSGETR